MTLFCGDLQYENISSIASSSKSECLVDVINLLLNCALIVLCSSILIWYTIMESYLRRRKSIIFFQEHSSRWVLTICLVCINLFEFGEGVMVNYYETGEPRLHLIISPSMCLTASVTSIAFYHKVEQWNRPQLLLVLLMYWPLVLICKFSKLICLYQISFTIQHLRLQITWAILVVYTLLMGIEITLLYLQRYLCKKSSFISGKDLLNIRYLHPFVTVFSKATFFWLVPVLRLGYRKPLELDDLGNLPEEELAEYQFQRFYQVFLEEKEKAESKGRKLSLWRCYAWTFWKTLAVGGIIKIIGDLVGLVGPLSINIILGFVESVTNEDKSIVSNSQSYVPTTFEFLQNGFVMAFVVLIATFLQSTFSNNFNHLAIMEGVHLRSALQCLVYKKSLKMGISTGLDSGAIVNHMSVDAFNMMMLFSMGHYIWAVPFKITLLLILLYMQLGYSALIGAATIYILAPLQYYICSKLSYIQKKTLEIADDRLKRISELLQGIKILKLYGWEMKYANHIEAVREKELKLLKKDAIYVALNTFITQASSIIVTLVTFAIYSKIEGKALTPSEVFTGLALFNQLTVPLYIIPFVIPIVINSVVSTKRLSEFLNHPEVDFNVPWRDDDGPAATVEYEPESGSVLLHVKENIESRSGTTLFGLDDSDGVFLPEIINYGIQDNPVIVSIQNGYFAWGNDTVLYDINLQISAGKLTAIVGPVGSGKSSLLSVLLGELYMLKGNVQWSSTSYVAYVPQKPWLLNATLKENILFGQPYNGRRYHQVIQACALQSDINLLPYHDLTEIGERGVNLSGGQKQRIALARAFYSQARVVILDDPLSALDAHVETHVFEQGIKTLLIRRQRTAILVTNKLEHLSHAAKVILLEDGKIKSQGTYSEVEKVVKEQSAVWKKIIIPKEKMYKTREEEQAFKDRHKFSRLLSKQILHRATSTQEVRPRARLVSLSRQLSHDPSSPLPCHDWADHDDPLPTVRKSEQSSTNPIKSILSTDSLRSRSSTSSGGIYRYSWKSPIRLNSRISVHTEEMIEEEEEQQLQDLDSGSEEKLDDLTCGKLIKEEERERGKISKKVYLMFMKACTLSLAILVIALIISTQAVKIGADFWLSKWSEASFSNNTSENDPVVKKYVGVYALLSGIGILLSLVTNLAAQLTSLRAVRVLFSQMLNTIVCCPMRFFDTTPIGRILNRFSSDMNTIDKKLPVTLPVLLRFLLLCISAIIVDVIVTPYFLAAVVPIVAIYYFLQHYFRFSSRELQRLDSITKSPVFSHFTETISGLTTIRAYREEKRFTEMLTFAINNNNAAFIMVNCANCWLGIALDYLGGIILFLATIASITAAITNHVSPAFVGMAMTYTLLVPIYLNWVVRNLASVEMYMNAVERVKEYSELQIEDYGKVNNLHKEELIEWLKDWPNKGQIIFENVTLKYDEKLDPVLRNITLTFSSGEKVGICGRTGSGKSSLVMAIFRMLVIADGNIYIDGVDITQIPLDILRSRLSIIPQDIVLFSGSVRENLDPCAQYNDEELWNSLKIAQLYDLVISMPGGLDAELIDEGSNFSVGQRQLFCLARAILKKSKILIMDEATSSLDLETDQVLQKVVASQCAECTVLTIAHRISSILSYDKVIVLDSGHIVEIGHPDELLQRRGSLFASLVKASEHHT